MFFLGKRHTSVTALQLKYVRLPQEKRVVLLCVVVVMVVVAVVMEEGGGGGGGGGVGISGLFLGIGLGGLCLSISVGLSIGGLRLGISVGLSGVCLSMGVGQAQFLRRAQNFLFYFRWAGLHMCEQTGSWQTGSLLR